MQKITEGFARVGFSEALAAQLRHEEDRLRELRSRLAALEPKPDKMRKALDPAVAERLALRIEEYARKAPSAPGGPGGGRPPIVLKPVTEAGTRR